MSRSIFEDTRSIDFIFEKFHMLLIQHLNPKEVLNMTGYSMRINKLFANCSACMNKISVRVDGLDVDDPESLKYVMRSKRKYKHIRLMCYDHMNFSKFCIEMLEVFADNMITLEVYDMVVDETDPEDLQVLSKLQHLKVSAMKGNFQHIFMLPGMRYKSLTFENLPAPVDLKSIGEYETATKVLSLINCKFTNLETFTFFKNYCENFIIESNRREDWNEICLVLEKYKNKITELLVCRKKSPGVRLILFKRESPKEESSDEKEEVEKVKTGKFIEDKTALFTRRKPKILDEASNVKTQDEFLNCSTKATLETDEFSLPLLRTVSKYLFELKSVKIHNVGTSMVRELFRSFKKLEKVVTLNGDFENEFSSEMFKTNLTTDPIAHLPINASSLVFQHFTYSELMAGTTVSKMWNQVIGQTETFMERVALKLNPSGFKENGVAICKNSQRNYTSLEISCNNSKNYSLSALEIVHVYSSCVIELTLIDINLEKLRILNDRFLFKQLSYMILRNVNEVAYKILLQNCETLKSLSISSMPFTKKILDRLAFNKNLEAVTLIDCTFEYFKTVKVTDLRKGEKSDKVDLKLKFFGLLFDRVNCWKVQKNDDFTKFLKCFSLSSVETLLLSGVRGEHMSEIFRIVRRLKKLILKHFWENELNAEKFYEIQNPFEFETLTLNMGQNYKWKIIFPAANQIIVKRQTPNNFYKDDEIFKNILNLPSAALISRRIFAPRNLPTGHYDPIIRISDKIHDLVFQHLTGHDILNMFEVSRTWNNFCKNSEVCARNTILFLKYSSPPDELALVEKSTRKFFNVVSDFYSPTMVNCFSNLRKLALAFHVPVDFKVPEAFPHLESLIIRKCPAKFYNHTIILKCFEIFVECKTLKFLEIYESITIENYDLIQDLLANNHELKTLKVHQCSEFFYLFADDFSHRIHFKLDHLDFRVPQKYSLVGSSFEQNFARFIRKQTSLKIIDFNLCSAVMLNAVFQLPNIHTVRMLRITGYDHVELQKNYTIKEFMFPDTPQLYILNSNQYFDYKPFFDAIPNVELLYVFSLTAEMVIYIAKNLKHVKYLTSDRHNGFDVERAVTKIRSSYDRTIVNRTMKVYKTRFNLIDQDERSFDRIFGIRKVRK